MTLTDVTRPSDQQLNTPSSTSLFYQHSLFGNGIQFLFVSLLLLLKFLYKVFVATSHASFSDIFLEYIVELPVYLFEPLSMLLMEALISSEPCNPAPYFEACMGGEDLVTAPGYSGLGVTEVRLDPAVSE